MQLIVSYFHITFVNKFHSFIWIFNHYCIIDITTAKSNGQICTFIPIILYRRLRYLNFRHTLRLLKIEELFHTNENYRNKYNFINSTVVHLLFEMVITDEEETKNRISNWRTRYKFINIYIYKKKKTCKRIWN